MTAADIWQEIVCDSMADMNIFDNALTSIAPQLDTIIETTQKTVEETKKSPRAPPVESGGKYSIVSIQSNNNDYGIGVLLDTNLFDGIKPRNWNKTLSQFVYNNLAGKEITVINENGEEEIISFAKKNERVQKDGAQNSHKVIDKLARTKGNVNALSIVHIDELLQTAKSDGNNTNHTHQWMDEHGWTLKKAYVQTLDGKIYETTLNIAKSRDGRNILYALSNTKQVGVGDVPSAQKGRGSHITTNLSVDSIAQTGNTVNNNSMQNSENDAQTENGRHSIVIDPETVREWEEKLKKYGAIPKGEKPVRDISVPKKSVPNKYVSQFARTMMESKAMPDVWQGEFEKLILDGKMSHERLSNDTLIEEATMQIDSDGYEETLRDWEGWIKSDQPLSAQQLATGQMLFNMAAAKRDVQTSMKLAADLAVQATRAGQSVQAFRLLKNMNPDGQLYLIEKQVENINLFFKKKIKKHPLCKEGMLSII